MFAGEIHKKRVQAMRQHTHWRWHLDEIYVRINGVMHYLLTCPLPDPSV
jgi:putative transposase